MPLARIVVAHCVAAPAVEDPPRLWLRLRHPSLRRKEGKRAARGRVVFSRKGILRSIPILGIPFVAKPSLRGNDIQKTTPPAVVVARLSESRCRASGIRTHPAPSAPINRDFASLTGSGHPSLPPSSAGRGACRSVQADRGHPLTPRFSAVAANTLLRSHNRFSGFW